MGLFFLLYIKSKNKSRETISVIKSDLILSYIYLISYIILYTF